MLRFLRHNLRWIAGGFLLTFFSSFGQTFFISASIGEWRSAFALSHGEFGRLYMAATLASALCLPFVGRLVDVLPEHRSVMLVIPVLAAATVIAAYAPSVPLLLFGIFLLRLFGQGMMTHIALTATGRWFSAQRGRAVSLVVLGHQGGEATLPLAFAALSLAVGYRTGWLLGAVTLLLVALPLIAWAYHRAPATVSSSGTANAEGGLETRQWTRAEVLRDPVFWVLLVGVLAAPFTGTTIFYHQDYLTDLKGWPPQLFALSLSLAAFTTVVCALIGGALVDRFRAITLLPGFLLPLGGACFVLAVDGPHALLFLAMFLLGIAYGFSSTLFGALWPEIYGIRHLGAIRSLTVSAMVLATAAGPGITSSLIDRGISVPVQMNWIGAYCLLAAAAMIIAAWLLRQRGP
jgi:MFS family permease